MTFQDFCFLAVAVLALVASLFGLIRIAFVVARRGELDDGRVAEATERLRRRGR
jgi:hypothetical protein